MNTWYSTITNKGSAHEQGLIIEEKTGNAIAVCYNPENAKLIAAAPELLEALQALINSPIDNADHHHRTLMDAERAISKATEYRANVAN
jgi:hypothetical protein